MKYTPRKAALIALALAWPLAHAQSPSKPASPAPATKSFGGKPGSKLLTREELRACLALREQVKASGPELERDKAELQREKAALQEAGDALKTEREAQERSRQEATSAFRAKGDAHAQRIDAFNARAAELAELEKQGRGNRAERLRKALESEHADLKKSEEALQVEMNALNKANADSATTLNARIAEHEQNVRAWNERNDAFTARVQGHRSTDDRWLAQCADRRYDELDEIAIRQGK
jgi:hypothetical protein